MSFTVILLSGKQGAGKSTLAEGLSESLDAVRMKFADPLYKMHDCIRGVLSQYKADNLIDSIDGPLLQILGTEWGRNTRGEDIWVNCAMNGVSNFVDAIRERSPQDHPIVVFDDCRFPNELSAFDPYSVKIRLEADEDIRKVRAQKWRNKTDHPSEIALDKERFDLVLDTQSLSADRALGSALAYIRLKIAQHKAR